MYRTLIVDDEPLMRQYLNNTISQLDPEFHVTGIACDGLEAMDLLRRQSFDLIITDIKMPEMDGLALTKYIFETDRKSRIVIISGYNEFEYARLAIRYNVSEYLLKPLSDQALSETLLKVRESLSASASGSSTSISRHDYTEDSDKEITSSLLHALVLNDKDQIQLLYNQVTSRNLVFMGSYASVLLICLDELHLLLQEKEPMEYSTVFLTFHQCCERYCKESTNTAFVDPENTLVILLSSDTEKELDLQAEAVYHEFCRAFWPHEAVKLNASFGYHATDILHLAESYHAARESLALTLEGVTSPIRSNYYISQHNFITKLNMICDSIAMDFISQNTDKLISDLHLYLTLFQTSVNTAVLLRYGTYLIRFLVKQCNIKSEILQAAFLELTRGADDFIASGAFDNNKIHSLFYRLIRILDNKESFVLIPETTNVVEQAKEYICLHYKEQISLAMVADTLGVTPSYLSDLFHKNIGEPYTKFLTRIRMEQALLLLRSNPNEKIYRIAEQTGFVSPKHFNAVFKKYYGFTPTEYVTQPEHAFGKVSRLPSI